MLRRAAAALEDLCPVCGDRVSGYHYGLLTCESCKGFFKRTVQNNKTYTCAESRACGIDVTQRKRCPSCRFQKCLHVGMRLEAVRADRIRGGRNKFGPMYKRDRALKQQREALIRAGVSSPPGGASTHRDLTFGADLHPGPALHCGYQNPTPGSLLPPDSPGVHRYQWSSNWTIKSEHADPAAEVQSSSLSPPGMPPLVVEFVRCDPDELQLQNRIAARLLQENHGEPSSLSLMCHMADQTLVSVVDWARSSIFFRQLTVNDQMKLLHSCWSDLLVLDLVSRQVLYGREGRLLLATGREVDLVDLVDLASRAGPTEAGLVQRGQELLDTLHVFKVDRQEFACFKFIVLFNPGVQQLEAPRLVECVQQQAEAALQEYTRRASSHLLGRGAQLLPCLSELRSLAALAEDFLYGKQLSGEVPSNNLLMEMLHAKRSLRPPDGSSALCHSVPEEPSHQGSLKNQVLQEFLKNL
ncbi:steroidogenic factor 1-like [Pseudoliparis swirei]|uniref:steroidogenic factor 1-like n=1 Tax=Pseudoliparis swirei TaxID=2059687 RepID=UPI0024BD6BF4|nr:steroidogenic factor 1-like [Pseudoliparis swirei]